MVSLLLVLVAGVAAVSGPRLEAAHAAGAMEVTSFGTNPGALKMFRYVPSGLPAGAPMVVAMHGCTQSAAAYDDEPGWVALAERWKFTLVLPEQQASNNSSRCFNWFQSADITRGSGEALSIKQMVDKTKADLGSNPARTFVTGLSAGGAMTSVMLADYPEVFAGGAIMAGIPFRCATTVIAAFSCLNPGVHKTPSAWGDLVRSATAYTGTRPTVQIWQGTSDSTVRPLNMTELVDQWTDVAGADQTADVQETVLGYPHSIYRDASGRNAVELYSLTGMDHGTPVDPGTGPTQCGTAGPYILDVNICSSYHIAKSWGLDTAEPT
jgi:poly(hydroxyalkanoate) depolymerase family esterase